jgi:peptidoglycan-associated lipoprotein
LQKAEWLRENPARTVTIEGHCDDRGTNEYNLALGDRRAESAKTFLVDLGIDATRLITISYGEERPVDPRSNEEAWAKNRRDHFVVN